jgi:hypothetical protein
VLTKKRLKNKGKQRSTSFERGKSADEIEITMSKKAGVGLASDVDGVPIEFIVGASGTMKLKIKYK